MGTDEKFEFATPDALRSAAKGPLPIDKVYSPGLKKWFWCQGMNSLDRSRWERSFMRRGKIADGKIVQARGTLLVRCLVTDEKERRPMYSEADVEMLGQVPAVVIEPIYDMCRKLSGIGEDQVEELEQLSAETQPSGSATS